MSASAVSRSATTRNSDDSSEPSSLLVAWRMTSVISSRTWKDRPASPKFAETVKSAGKSAGPFEQASTSSGARMTFFPVRRL